MADFDDFGIVSMLQMLSAQMKDAAEGTNRYSQAVSEQIARQEQQRIEDEAYAEDEERRNAARERQAKTETEAKKKLEAATTKTKESFKKLGNEINQIITAGVKLGGSLGVSATKGVEIEFKNRVASVASLLNFNANLIQSAAQIQSAQEGFTTAFIGAREGFQVSSRGAGEFVKSLKEGFKSEFTPTAETFKILTQMGMSTTTQFDAFRRATGRASLSNNQLSTLYNKNQLSFLLYGNSFAKAAVQAERLGINLASIQSAQESLVTNLDGTIDTVAQINQLGGSIDFSELVRISEQEGPDALMAYIRATVPEYMMQGASTRALFRQLGISVEDFEKAGNKQQSAAEELEKRMTDAASQTGRFTRGLSAFFTFVGSSYTVLATTFGGLIVAIVGAIMSLRALAVASMAAAGLPGTLPPILGTGGSILGGAAGLAIGIGGGTAMAKEMGASTTAGLVGSSIGSLLAGGIGFAIGGPVGFMIGSALGGMLGGGITGAMKLGGDVVSAPGKGVSISREGTLIQSLAGIGGNLTQVGELTRGVRGAGILSGIFDTLQYSEKFRNDSNTAELARNVPYSSLMAGLSAASVIGGVGLTAAALAGTVLTGGMAPLIIGALASMGTSAALNKMIGDDVMSMPSGYGDRILLTPEGPIALNNKDTVMAFADDMVNTSRLPLGYLAALMGGAQTNNSTLINKVENLISVISSAKTNVVIDNKIQQVPRMAMAGAYFRNERV